MKWFDRWFAKKCKQAWENERNYSDAVPISVGSSKGVIRESAIRSDGIRMNMYHANGGYILEFENYDRHTDRMDRDLYVINDDAKVGENIAQTITMHLLKH